MKNNLRYPCSLQQSMFPLFQIFDSSLKKKKKKKKTPFDIDAALGGEAETSPVVINDQTEPSEEPGQDEPEIEIKDKAGGLSLISCWLYTWKL